jgi:hypothetical protein
LLGQTLLSSAQRNHEGLMAMNRNAVRVSGARDDDRQASASHIELVPTGSLKPYRNNARTHSKRQIKDIARSIERFGFTNPVLVDADRQIIAGHGRVAAAKLLNIKAIPTLRIDHLNEAEKRAYVLADNKLAERAGWDREILAIELQGLIDLDFEIGLTGFEMAEVDLILDDASERAEAALQPEDETPEVASGTAVTRMGDIWVLGAHRLLCGDSLDVASYEAVLSGRMAECVFADPPYNVPIDGHVSGLGRTRHRDFAMASGEMSEAQFIAFLQKILRQLTVHTTNGSIHFICMDWRHSFELLTAGRGIYRELKNICVWSKSNAGMGSFTGPSTSWCSCGRTATRLMPTILSWASSADREPTSGTMRASIRYARGVSTSSQCIPP